MRTDGLDYDGHKVGALYRTLARTVSETDIVNFVNLCGFVEPLFIDMEYVKRASIFPPPGGAGRAHIRVVRGPHHADRADPRHGHGVSRR
jgi:acyl dehydratase